MMVAVRYRTLLALAGTPNDGIFLFLTNLGEVDDSIEPLGPGGYHIVMAAIVSDLAKSSLVNFWAYLGSPCQDSVKNCLRTAELANARLVLEGQERFFNFDGKDDDYASLFCEDMRTGMDTARR
jgi:hypothetical protein